MYVNLFKWDHNITQGKVVFLPHTKHNEWAGWHCQDVVVHGRIYNSCVLAPTSSIHFLKLGSSCDFHDILQHDLDWIKGWLCVYPELLHSPFWHFPHVPWCSQLVLSFGMRELIKQVTVCLEILGGKWIMWAAQVLFRRLNLSAPCWMRCLSSFPFLTSVGHGWLFLSFRKQQQCHV